MCESVLKLKPQKQEQQTAFINELVTSTCCE